MTQPEPQPEYFKLILHTFTYMEWCIFKELIRISDSWDEFFGLRAVSNFFKDAASSVKDEDVEYDSFKTVLESDDQHCCNTDRTVSLELNNTYIEFAVGDTAIRNLESVIANCMARR